MYPVVSIIVLLLVHEASLSPMKDKILSKRRAIIAEEEKAGIGSHLVLNSNESKLNSILLDIKKQEYNESLQQAEFYPPSVHFFAAKSLYEKSSVFDIIRGMPKGADLHLHEVAMVKPEWIVANLTYLPDLYFCTSDNTYNSLRFKFSTSTPQKLDTCKTEYQKVSEARESAPSVEEFDQALLSNMSMTDPTMALGFIDYTVAWNRFIAALTCVTDLVYTGPGFKPYFRQALQELYEDNILFVEVRSLLFPIVEVNGTAQSQEYTLLQYQEVTSEFKAEHDDFVGARIIFISVRQMSATQIKDDIQLAMQLHEKYPDFMIGYDLVGIESTGPPLIDLIDILITPASEKIKLPFFFHAGETDWFGTSTDENLIDAILLNTTRIGHGYALPKHPVVLKLVKEKDVPIEVNPLSNQVLGLVRDLRDHPGTYFFSRNFSIVICSDDPAAWGAIGLSYDYYAAFMAFTDLDIGLTFLKQISLNGILYSTLEGADQEAALALWQQKWDSFVESALERYESSDANNFVWTKTEL